MPIATTHNEYPPFAPDVETAPLVSISLARLEDDDADESLAFFEASKTLGFFYLDMHGSKLGESLVREAESLHQLQRAFFALPRAEKDQYTQDKVGPFYAYRPIDHPDLGMDVDGLPRRNESYNFRKDDILGHSPSPRPVHPLVWAQRPLLESYTRHCRAAIDLMLVHLERHLALPVGTLAALHRVTEMSGDHIRFNQTAAAKYDAERAKGGEHTDFGTLTILFNWLGGLQIRKQTRTRTRTQEEVPDEWVYVKPVPGCAVVNLGDALVIFTAGILRSNVHRVVPPPPPQNGVDRNSLVYFSRPEDAAIMRRLKGGIIDAQPDDRAPLEEMTSETWIMRRSLGDLKGIYTHDRGFELKKEYDK